MTDPTPGDPPPRRPVARKEYYSIGEVCELTGLKAHVLRYWETQFRILQPGKNQAGNRVYRPREIKLILLLKYLLHDQKYTIEGARQRLHQMRQEGDPEDHADEILSSDFLSAMKDELRTVLDVLTLPENT